MESEGTLLIKFVTHPFVSVSVSVSVFVSPFSPHLSKEPVHRLARNQRDKASKSRSPCLVTHSDVHGNHEPHDTQNFVHGSQSSAPVFWLMSVPSFV